MPATATHEHTFVPLFISIKDAAALASVSQDLIRDLIAKGTLPAARVGTSSTRGAWRIKRADLIALFSGERVG